LTERSTSSRHTSRYLRLPKSTRGPSRSPPRGSKGRVDKKDVSNYAIGKLNKD
jgi:hypothetical protein